MGVTGRSSLRQHAPRGAGPRSAAATGDGSGTQNDAAAPAPHSNHRRRRTALVYRGEGAGWRSVQSTVSSLRRLLPAGRYDVSTLAPQGLLRGAWADEAALLVMPGGADLPYCAALNGRGNALIRGEGCEGGGAV
jgi:hypothetical protein